MKKVITREDYNIKCFYDFIEIEEDKLFKYTIGFDNVLYVNKDRTEIRYLGNDILKEEDFKDWKWADIDYFIIAAKKCLDPEDSYAADQYEVIDVFEENPDLIEEVEKDLETIDFDMTGFEKYYPGYDLRVEDVGNHWTEKGFALEDLKEIDEFKGHFNIPIFTLFEYDNTQNILVMWNNMQGYYDKMTYVPAEQNTIEKATEYLEAKDIYI